MRSIFLTGGSGFIGREVLRLLNEADDCVVTCLARRPEMLAAFRAVKVVSGDLLDPTTYSNAIPSGATVLHLAAATGNASPATHWTVNVEGTRRLLEAGRKQNIDRIIFVSSIATTFRDQRYYHYAQAKAEAERLVRTSGLPYLIVRPTMVVGAGSPIQAALRRLAGAPAMIVFGSGKAMVQPIHAGELARCLVALCMSRSRHGIIEIGGPHRLPIEALIQAYRRDIRGRVGPVIHVPTDPLRKILAVLEKVLPGRLPVTAGQLGMFVNDGCARANPLPETTAPAHESSSTA